MIRCVIFDLDGTITQPYFDFDQIRRQIGIPENGKTILEAMEHMSEDEKNRVNGILKYHEDAAVEQSILNPGARYTLESLRNSGIPVGILTRNLRQNALAVAEKHSLIFDAIVDRTDGPVKPDAFGVLHLCDLFDAKPGESLVVGDFLYDLLSAKAAGAYSVLIKNHKDSDDFLHYADFVIERLDEILTIIDNLKRQ